MENGASKEGYAVVTLHQILESSSPALGTAAQLAELIVLTRSLQLTEGQKVNIYTDEDYIVNLHYRIP